MSTRDALVYLAAALLQRHAMVDHGDHAGLTCDALLTEAAGILEAIDAKAKKLDVAK